MKHAFIDVGTNTALLLVVEVSSSTSFEVLCDEMQIVRLGEGLEKNHVFLETAKQRTLQALQNFQKTIQDLKCDSVRAVGTASFRKAKNAKEFQQEIFAKTKISLEIISGEEEARLIAKATVASFDEVPKPYFILDIGGGSTELIKVSDEALDVCSMPFGVVKLTESYLKTECPTVKEKYELLENITPQIQSVKNQFGTGQVLIATAGTATTIASLIQRLEVYDANAIHKSQFSLHELQVLRQRLEQLPIEERIKLPGLPEKRADVIVSGCLVLETVMTIFGFEKTFVSDQGLRYGLLRETLPVIPAKAGI